MRRCAKFDAMQKTISEMEATENQLLQGRAAQQEHFQERTGAMLINGGLFSVLLSVALSVLAVNNARTLARANRQLQREIGEKRRAEARLQELVEELKTAKAQLENGNAHLERLNGEFERGNMDLQRSNAELEQFAYVASHDLQEPLRAVSGCVQVLQRRYEGKLDERAGELINHAVDGATRMQTLINDLLTFSRVGTHGKPFEPVDMSNLLKRVLSNLAPATAESGAIITHDAMPEIVADGGQIEQVLQNLISNALKFRDAKPPAIYVGTRRDDLDAAWIFSVRDNGPGIEPKYFERIFVMFQRLHTRTDYPGTGIGLAVCKKIVERHGGIIRVESAPQEGATFSFSIPDGVRAPVVPGLVAIDKNPTVSEPTVPASAFAASE